MASKLLNVLEEIENSRQQIIKDARQKNYHLDDDASFEEIGDLFKELPVSTGKLLPMSENPETLLERDGIVINNIRSETFNEQEFLDYLQAFKTTNDIDGYTLMSQFIVDNSSSTITFAAAGSYSTTLSSTLDQIQIGNMGHSYYADHPVDFKVITSDGGVYDFNFVNTSTNITHQHTWDTTKDINNKRWFKVFIKMHKEADIPNRAQWLSSSSYLSSQAYIGYIPVIAYYINRFFYSTYNLYAAGANTNPSRETFKYIFETNLETEDTADLKAYVDTHTLNRMNISLYIGSSSSYWKNFKAILSDTKYYVSLPSFNTYDGYTYPVLDVREHSIFSPTTGSSAISKYWNSNKRIVPYTINEQNPDPFILTKNGLYSGVSPNNPHRYINRSQFLTYPGALPEDQHITTLGSASTTSYAYASFVPGSVIDIPDTVTSIGRFAFFNSGANTGELDLHHVDTVIGADALSDCYAIMIRLDNVRTLNYTLFDYIYCRELTLEGLEQTTARLGNHAFGMLRLDIPKLEEYAFTFPESPTIEIINAPKLKHLIEKPFIMTDNNACFAQLHTLILGEGIETNLNLSTCISLSKESVLDIINKLKDYSEGDSHTLTLYDYQYSLLTAEEIAIATNKNWVVTYATST